MRWTTENGNNEISGEFSALGSRWSVTRVDGDLRGHVSDGVIVDGDVQLFGVVGLVGFSRVIGEVRVMSSLYKRCVRVGGVVSVGM